MEDEKIIELYWRREEAAIAQTAEKYGCYCFSIAQNILSSTQDSEECVNDTYLRAWNTMPPQRPERLQLFLGRITRNLAFDRYRSATARKRGAGEITAVLDELAKCIPGHIGPEEHFLAQELEQAVAAFVRKLPAEDGNIFVRRYYFVESAGEIAERYGMRAGQVRTRLSRTRSKLKEYLEKEGYLL